MYLDFDNDKNKKLKMEEIGYRRLYETMVFRLKPELRNEALCGCHDAVWTELDSDGYMTAIDAQCGHVKMVSKYVEIYHMEQSAR